jgi:protein SCO1/2
VTIARTAGGLPRLESSSMTRRTAILAGIVAAVLTAAAGVGIVAYLAAPDGSIGGSFTLIAGDGAPVTERSFRGKWELVYFGYTYCPDACPTTLSTIAETLAALGPLADRLQPLFITVDPERDTPAAMAAYVRNFDPRIVGLTGSPAAIASVAKAFRIIYARHKTGDGPTEYLMDHSSVLIVMDPDGRFAGVIAADLGADRMTDKLRRLLAP